MKRKLSNVIPAIMVIIVICGFILGQICLQLYCQKRYNGIVALSNSMFFIDSILVGVDEEAWENSISNLELQSSLIYVSDDYDNKKLCDLINAIIIMPSASENRKEVIDELNNLTVSWDTRKWHWSCEIVEGDVDKIIELCQWE